MIGSGPLLFYLRALCDVTSWRDSILRTSYNCSKDFMLARPCQRLHEAGGNLGFLTLAAMAAGLHTS